MYRKHRTITLLLWVAILNVRFIMNSSSETPDGLTTETSTTTTSATTTTSSSTSSSSASSTSSSSESSSSGSGSVSTTVSVDSSSILPKDMDKLEIALIAVNFIPNKDKDGKKRVQFWVFYADDGTNEPKIKSRVTSGSAAGFELDFPIYAFSTIVYETSNIEYETLWNDAKSNNMDWKNIEDLDKAKNYPIVLKNRSQVSSFFINVPGSDLKNQTLIVEFNDNNLGINKGYTLMVHGMNIVDDDNGKGTPTNNGLYFLTNNMATSTVNDVTKTGFFQMPDNDSNRTVAKELYKKHAKPYYKRAWFIILAILVGILLILMFSGVIGAICACFKKTGNDMTEKFVA
eukprot:GAHX01000115.1.p1 GENE.GAHX01000115.1~~GAHX01000115.1.p1  ORF type:complete len:345 (+),score=64.79 GAHX01000115.1:337-1371(+)